MPKDCPERRLCRPPVSVDVALGPLERRVLQVLWRRSSATVRELQPEFPATAYTTLMTTLDRLYRKGVLQRVKDGRAFQYRPLYSRESLATEIARRAIARILGPGRGTLRPVLSSLIDTITEHDHDALDELDRLVKARRDTERRKGEPV